MRLSIQVDSGATPYSARIPSAAVAPPEPLPEGVACVATTVAVGNSKWFDGGEATPLEAGEVAAAVDEDDEEDEEGDGADDEEDADDFLQGRDSKRTFYNSSLY